MNRAERRKQSAGCIFCAGGKLSREHIWPDWTREHFRDSPSKTTRSGVMEKAFTPNVRQVASRDRQGHPSTTRVRVVCKTCNNQWMSKLEAEVKPTLQAFLDGSAFELDVKDKTSLIHWVVMKLMVSEWINREVFFTSYERFAFRQRRELPRGMLLTMLTHDDEHWRCNYYAIAMSISSGQQSVGHNVKSFSLGIGNAVFNLMHTTIPGMFLSENIVAEHENLLPVNARPLQWPLSEQVSGRQIEEITNYLAILGAREGRIKVPLLNGTSPRDSPAMSRWPRA